MRHEPQLHDSLPMLRQAAPSELALVAVRSVRLSVLPECLTNIMGDLARASSAAGVPSASYGVSSCEGIFLYG